MPEPPADRLTSHERDLISEARRISPELRASGNDRNRLAGHLLDRLADLAERLASREERIARLEQTVSAYGELIDTLRNKVYALEHGRAGQ